MSKQIKLGASVQDKVTGFRGLVNARTEYLNGCVRIEVLSSKLKDCAPLGGVWFDEAQLEAVALPVGNKVAPSTIGGPSREHGNMHTHNA